VPTFGSFLNLNLFRPLPVKSIQGATTVMLRFGTWPTGMIALTFKLLMSTADVVFEPAFAT
jgi:hypothetical protein